MHPPMPAFLCVTIASEVIDQVAHLVESERVGHGTGELNKHHVAKVCPLHDYSRVNQHRVVNAPVLPPPSDYEKFFWQPSARGFPCHNAMASDLTPSVVDVPADAAFASTPPPKTCPDVMACSWSMLAS